MHIYNIYTHMRFIEERFQFQVHLYIHIYVCMCMYMLTFVCACVYMLYIYIYVYIQTLCLKTSMHDYPYIDCIAHNSFTLSHVHKEKGKNV